MPNDRLRIGDLVYLVAGNAGLYGLGYVNTIERYQDRELSKEMMRVLISRPVVQSGIASLVEIKNEPELSDIVDRLDGNFVELTPRQVNTFNRLLRVHGAEAPGDVSEIQDRIGKFGYRDASSLQARLRLAVDEFNLASLLFIDLDNFKSVNDEYNHKTGDEVIKDALSVMESVIDGQGSLFHRSGDEMMVLLPNMNAAVAGRVAEDIREAIQRKAFKVIGEGFVTATIAVGTYPGSCPHWEELENRTDQALSEAKKLRKNWVLVLADGV
jgi:diguanylate cyclase (GGDEF)-like protein